MGWFFNKKKKKEPEKKKEEPKKQESSDKKEEEKPAEQQVDAKQDDGFTVGELKRGEYLIHVFIEETRALRNPKEDDQTVDPIIEITVGNKTIHSKTKEKVGTGATFWGEHFFFDTNYETTYEAEREKIIIKVKNHRSFGTDALIGTVETSLPTIYYKDDHVLQYQWAALAGLTKKFQEVLGYIKFSIGVFAVGDDQKKLEPEKKTKKKRLFGNKDEDDGDEDPGVDVLFPPQINTKPYQLSLKIFKAENLRTMDKWGKCDPFVRIVYAGMTVRTNTVKENLNPVWNKDLLLPISIPTISDIITIQLMDEDSVGKNEAMGCQSFKIDDIIAGKHKSPQWINIYGAPKDPRDAYKDSMNEIPETATWWQGRVQISVDIEAHEKPICACIPIQDQQILQTAQQHPKKNFQMIAQVYYALNLPKDDDDFSVSIRWADQEVKTKEIKSKGRMCYYNQQLSCQLELPIDDLNDNSAPDVYIYIQDDDDKRFSYLRKTSKYFTKQDVRVKDYTFNIERCKSDLREELAGIVRMRIFVFDPSEGINLDEGNWNELHIRQNVPTWNVFFNLYQVRNLMSSDDDGLADPYAKIYHMGQTTTTETIENTTNPVYNHQFQFKMSFDNVNDASPIIVSLWDKDKGTFSDDEFLGQVIIKVKKSELNPEGELVPGWKKLKYGKKTGDFGKVLYLSQAYNNSEKIPRSIYEIEPEYETYHINLKILGLRELESSGLLPVRRAFCKFDVDGIKSKKLKTTIKDKKYIMTEPLYPGRNPNILTVINLKADLPKNPDYCPALNVSVFDNIMKGWVQPLIGNLQIDLGEYIRVTEKKFQKKLQVLEQIKQAVGQNLQGGLSNMIDIKVDKEHDGPEAVEQKRLKRKQTINKIKSKASKALIPSDFGLDDVNKIVIFPPSEFKNEKYNDDDDQEEQKEGAPVSAAKKAEAFEEPDPDCYMALGYEDKKDPKIKKHFRYYVKDSLENIPYIGDAPFSEIDIFRGSKVHKEANFFRNLFAKEESFKKVGFFKAMISVTRETDLQTWEEQSKNIAQSALTHAEVKDDEFLRRTEVVVRVYILEAEGLASKDEDSNSDPYLIVSLGNKKYNEKSLYQEDEPNPKFHKCYEFESTLPGASRLKIALMDHDKFGFDSLIGKTTIDVENRFFNKAWGALPFKPVEVRELFNPSSSIAQGKIKLWVDILPKMKQLPDIWITHPKPPMDFEIRVVVWNARDVPKVDTAEDAVDIYVTGKIGETLLKTDTHFRSLDGNGSFNWRLVFPVKFPLESNLLTLQLWDKDIISKDDYISEVQFDFERYARDAFKLENEVIIKKDGSERFWLDCTKLVTNKEGEVSTKKQGKLEVSMTLVPGNEAKLVPAGQGRSKPNQNPFLPPPVGRFEFTLNPFKLFTRMFGPVARAKFYGVCCLLICLVITFFCIPDFLGEAVYHIIS